MSHVTTIDVEIKSLDALKRGAARCGMKFNEGQTSYRWFGEHVGDYPLPDGFTVDDMGKCEHALSVADDCDAYEIGIVRSRTGAGWTLLFDFWNGGQGLEARTGKNCDRLMQFYALEVARDEAQAFVLQGWTLEEVHQPNGDIQLVLTDGGGDGW